MMGFTIYEKDDAFINENVWGLMEILLPWATVKPGHRQITTDENHGKTVVTICHADRFRDQICL